MNALQGSLLDAVDVIEVRCPVEGQYHATDVNTSKAAAKRSAHNAAAARVLILRALYQAGERGATAGELSESLGLKDTSVGTRLGPQELRGEGLTEQTDRERSSREHGPGKVHVLTEAGRRYVERMSE